MQWCKGGLLEAVSGGKILAEPIAGITPLVQAPQSLIYQKGYWPCQILGWSAFGGLQVLAHTLMQKPVMANLPFIAILIISCFLVSHGFRAFLRRSDWLTLPLTKLGPRLLLALPVLSITMHLLMTVAFFIGAQPEEMWTLPQILISTVNGTVIFFFWTAIYFGVHYFFRFQASERARWQSHAATREAELRALKAQINPHFLFNCLNSACGLIPVDPHRATKVLTQVSDLLRYSLNANQQTTVKMQTELEMVNRYLELERVRLEERLRYQIEVPPEMSSLKVPVMMVQMLVENSIKHGIAQSPQGGFVTIKGRTGQDSFTIEVINTGNLSDNASPDALGLRNISDRLKLLYGDRACFRIEQASPDTVSAQLHLPREPRP